ncbi:dihydropteroate synthase-like protein [Promethearchaeum syntrophicum]|uniref:Dihydropteroate synthase-like protein n=1 Tax=Promethearchaeum syntrophicum TaxID=2594042 RepID=A0A5B9DA40_9ARCH
MNRKTRILLITGRDAFNDIKLLDWSDLQSIYEITIIQAQIPIISLISPKILTATLSEFDANDFDLVITSGLIPWNLKVIKSPFSSKIKKGPRFLVNLPELIKNFDPFNFSPETPADKLYRITKKENLELIIEKNRQDFRNQPHPNGFILKNKKNNIFFNPNLPPVLIGEIVDAPKLSFDDISFKVESYIKNGVNVIDFGCIANENHSDVIFEMISQLKKKFQIPFSIDSINSDEIHSAINAGAQMVLSITVENYSDLLDLNKDTALVIIPTSQKEHNPLTSQKKIERLIHLWKVLIKNGFTKILMDPITGVPISPGFTSSIEILSSLKLRIDQTYNELKNQEYIHKPELFMGFGNVTELIDGDSSGINTLLSIIAVELGVSGILSTEFSNKCRNNLKELSESIKLAYYANQLHVPPLNLGITAFQFKSKQDFPKYISFNEPIKQIDFIDQPAIMDPKGYFKIYIDEKKKQIMITHFNNSVNFKDATLTLVGDNAESLYKMIIKSNLVSKLDHAAYLGKELIKAELALKLGMSYIQS